MVPKPLTPNAAPDSTTPEELVFLSIYIETHHFTRDLRNVITYLFHHKGIFFTETQLLHATHYPSSHETFLQDMILIESQFQKMSKAPISLLRKPSGSEQYTYAIVSRAVYEQYQQDEKAKRAIVDTSSTVHHAVQTTTLPINTQKWISSTGYTLLSPLRFLNSPLSVDMHVKSHCIYICLTELAAHPNEWLDLSQLETAIDASLAPVQLPSGYIWNTRFTVFELVQEMRSNTAVTNGNRLSIVTKTNPRAFMLKK